MDPTIIMDTRMTGDAQKQEKRMKNPQNHLTEIYIYREQKGKKSRIRELDYLSTSDIHSQ